MFSVLRERVLLYASVTLADILLSSSAQGLAVLAAARYDAVNGILLVYRSKFFVIVLVVFRRHHRRYCCRHRRHHSLCHIRKIRVCTYSHRLSYHLCRIRVCTYGRRFYALHK